MDVNGEVKYKQGINTVLGSRFSRGYHVRVYSDLFVLSALSVLCDLPSVNIRIIWQSDSSSNHGRTARVSRPGQQARLFFLFHLLHKWRTDFKADE